MKLFVRYASVGLVNTLIHWLAFWALYTGLALSQAKSNLAAFCVAVTFSFIVNALWTYSAKMTWRRYWLYVGFMGIMALSFGALADRLHIWPLATLVLFSAFSLIFGFLYSRYFVFKGAK